MEKKVRHSFRLSILNTICYLNLYIYCVKTKINDFLNKWCYLITFFCLFVFLISVNPAAANDGARAFFFSLRIFFYWTFYLNNETYRIRSHIWEKEQRNSNNLQLAIASLAAVRNATLWIWSLFKELPELKWLYVCMCVCMCKTTKPFVNIPQC